VRELIRRFRPHLLFAAFFSLAINLLLLAPPLYMLQVFDRVLASRSNETLALLTAGVLIALAMTAALDAVRARLLAEAGAALDRAAGPAVLEGLLAHAAARLDGREHASALRDVACLRAFFGGAGILSLIDAPWLPAFVCVHFQFHPLLGATATAGALLMLTLAFVNERATRVPLERAQAEGRRAGRFIDSSLRNADAAAALGMLGAVVERWTSANESALAQQSRAAAAGTALSALTRFSRQLVQTAMLAAGAYLVVDQHVTGGVMIATTVLLGRALAPVESLVAGWRSLVEARAAWHRLRKLVDEAPAPVLPTELPAPRGRVDAERAVFGVAGAPRPILRGVTFSVPAGEALGIVGPSASGKSTLARLVVGVWRPASGAVRLDGADVSAWPRSSLGPYVGYLPQDVQLFPGTVAENIARLAPPDDAAVVRAAQRAHVHELVLRLPKGYDTELGEGGAGLSPGQRQRIALARALYGSPRLVVLDEPNSNLDSEGDEALLATLRGLKEDGVTVLIIAHRPSLLVGVDRLLVLRDGAVDAWGPRAEVMARLVRNAAPPPLPAAAKAAA
jgi:PrtD family type I secretion system ABC transporter